MIHGRRIGVGPLTAKALTITNHCNSVLISSNRKNMAIDGLWAVYYPPAKCVRMSPDPHAEQRSASFRSNSVASLPGRPRIEMVDRTCRSSFAPRKQSRFWHSAHTSNRVRRIAKPMILTLD